ncbi:MAG: putative toxin-antitoxin system toxin component, PIN family [Prosthecobacter sp.]|jgi:putative PIN family toxin of toxin-antitoxin system|uniref:putative toxin-antitoxin system toxin component, PIN family n=1 Tax=Prosthecobacter sp. TaxID=1965333 RepID=UPI001A0A6AF4|nr:putative toxin-antitoxin system toxin component, PIN family [Prosthecobacter sp.]MBE2286349.1 putative toxin-antitoxin system toxin component, PIN family [Prosthecobacter sp.]
MPARIVVDTNVITAAMLSPAGSNRDVLRACLKGAALPLVGEALFQEYEDLIHRPALMAASPLTPKERETLLDAFLSVCEWVRVYYLWRPNLPDEADNHLIELAVAAGADAIVSSNVRDLRRSELSFPKLQILTPSQFLKSIRIP